MGSIRPGQAKGPYVGPTSGGGGGTVTGSGTTDFLPIWTAATVLGDSIAQQAVVGAGVGFGVGVSPLVEFHFQANKATLASFLAANVNVGAAAHLGMVLETAGGGGNPFYGYNNGLANVVHGLDSADSSKWKLASSGSSTFTNTRLTMTTAGLFGINETAPASYLHISSTSTNELMLQRAQAASTAVQFDIRRSRGTLAAPTGMTAGDEILSQNFRAFAVSFATGANIRSMVQATPGGGLTAGQLIELRTAPTGGTITGRLLLDKDGLGGVGPWVSPSTLMPAVKWHVLNDSGLTADMILQSSLAAASNSVFYLRKSRGTGAAPGDIVSGDYYGSIAAQGYSGSWLETASIRFLCNAAVTTGQRPASAVEFYSNANNAAPVRWGLLDSDGTWNLEGALTVIGAGGVGNARLRFDGRLDADPTVPTAMMELFHYNPASGGADWHSLVAKYEDGTNSWRAEIPMGQGGPGQAGNSLNVNANHALAWGDNLLYCDAGAGGITIDLDGGLSGGIFCIKKIAGAGPVTLDPGAFVIDGAASLDLTTQYSSVVIQCVNGDWYIRASHLL